MPDNPKKVRAELPDVIRNVAQSKREFAARAFKPVDKTIQAPGEVLMAGCQAIAEALVPHGFKFLKSDRILVRKRGEWVDRLSIDTSKYNVRGECVEISVSALACNTRIKKLRETHQSPFPFNTEWGTIAGGDIGRLSPDDEFLNWNIADPESRDAVLQDIIDHITQIALPYFDRFESFERVSREFVIGQIPRFDIRSAIELFASYDQHPEYLSETIARLNKFQKSGVPIPSGWCEEIAAAIVHYQLKVPGLPRLP